ncbi:hypothetical protein FFY45_21890 [Xanthomonas hortorum]|nr:hypothetical protein [Xanthomonas hortorum]
MPRKRTYLRRVPRRWAGKGPAAKPKTSRPTPIHPLRPITTRPPRSHGVEVTGKSLRRIEG